MDRLSKLYTKFSHAHPKSQLLIPSVVSSKKKNLIEIKHRIGKQSQKFELENWWESMWYEKNPWYKDLNGPLAILTTLKR